MPTDYRPLARAVLQNPTTDAYKTLLSLGALQLNRGTAIQALSQDDAQAIASTGRIDPALVRSLLERYRATGTYSASTRNAKPRRGNNKPIEIPATHTHALWIAHKPDGTRHTKLEWAQAIENLKANGALYGGDALDNAWFLPYAQWETLRTNPTYTTTRPEDRPKTNRDIAREIREEGNGLANAALAAERAKALSDVRQPAQPTPTVQPEPTVQPTTTLQETETTRPTTTQKDIDTMTTFNAAIDSLRTGAYDLDSLTALIGLAVPGILRTDAGYAAQTMLALLDGTQDKETREAHAEYAQETANDLAGALAENVGEPGDAPDMKVFLEYGREHYKTTADPSGMIRAREEFVAAKKDHTALQEAYFLAMAQINTLASVLPVVAIDTYDARAEQRREEEAKRLEEEAAEKAREAYKNAGKRLASIREELALLPILECGTRPALDERYNCPPEFQRLFTALAFQLALTGRCENLLFTGPKGTGKTKAASQLAASLGLDLFVLNCQTARDAREVFAERNADEGKTFWSDTAFTAAIKRGYCVILLDEITRAGGSVQNAFLSLLDGQGRVHINGYGDVTPGKNVVWLATANEGSAYTGTARLDLALDDRFSIRWEMAHLDTDSAANALMAHLGLGTTHVHPARLADLTTFAPVGIDHLTARALASIVKAIQTAYTENKASARLTHDEGQRTLEGMGRLYALVGAESLRYTLLSRYKPGEERDAVAQIVRNTTATLAI